MDAVRKRFTNDLQSYQVDDDYTSPGRSHLHASGSHMGHTTSQLRSQSHTPPHGAQQVPSNGFVDYHFDPNEEVPSYETSQLLHQERRPDEAPSRTSSVISTELGLLPGIPPVLVPQTNNNSSTRGRGSIKQVGLKFLNARQHFALAVCRDIALIPPLIGLVQSWRRIFLDDRSDVYNISLHYEMGIGIEELTAETRLQFILALTGARLPEHFLTGLWCIVAGYLSHSVLDGLIVRWIVTYLTLAAIVRVLSMSTIMLTVEQYLVLTFSADGYKYGLHIWILISCILTVTYIIQNFVTLNIDLRKGEKRARFFDVYNIVVFAVVPVGFASFITMIGLLRSLLIIRIDIDHALAT